MHTEPKTPTVKCENGKLPPISGPTYQQESLFQRDEGQKASWAIRISYSMFHISWSRRSAEPLSLCLSGHRWKGITGLKHEYPFHQGISGGDKHADTKVLVWMIVWSYRYRCAAFVTFTSVCWQWNVLSFSFFSSCQKRFITEVRPLWFWLD